MPSVDGQTGAITRPEERGYAEISNGYTYFEEEDVIFAKITPCMQNGKHAVASGLLNGFGFGSTEFHVLRPSENTIPEWIHKFLRQPSEKWLRKSEQGDKWNRCLIEGMIVLSETGARDEQTTPP